MAAAAASAVVVLFWLLSTWYFRHNINTPPGARRLAVCAPLFVGVFALPLLYDRASQTVVVMTVFSMLCLAAFKLLAWCMNRGPLCLPYTPIQLLAILHFPIMPAEVWKSKSGPPGEAIDDVSKLLGRCITKIALLGSMTQLVSIKSMPVLLHSYCVGLTMCFFLGAVQDTTAIVAVHWLGLKVAPLFDQPWKSRTVGEWWSHRWNVPASLIFRMMVYDPIIEGRVVLPPGKEAGRAPGRISQLQRLTAMVASFVLSGIGHELMYWYAMGHFSGWWSLFFLVQAPIAVAERIVKKQLEAAGIKIPALLDQLRVNFLVTLTAQAFFIHPATHAGLTDRLTGSIGSAFNTLLYPLSGHPMPFLPMPSTPLLSTS